MWTRSSKFSVGLWLVLLGVSKGSWYSGHATKQCGLVGGKTPECGALLESNCTSALELPRFCPASCPFVAQHPQLACSFTCAAAEECSSFNPGFAYPNQQTGLCEPCDIVGCKECAGNGTCLRCLPHFTKGADGRTCAYSKELSLRLGMQATARLIGTVVVLGLVVALIVLAALRCLAEFAGWMPWRVAKEGEDAHQHEADDLVRAEAPDPEMGRPEIQSQPWEEATSIYAAIKQAMKHRRKCKLRELDRRRAEDSANSVNYQVPKTHSVEFFVNMRERFLAGVGLMLYHSWFPFLALHALVMAVGTLWVYEGAELSSLLRRAGLQRASHALLALLSGSAGDDGSMQQCAASAAHIASDALTVNHAMHDFANRASIGYFVLWLLGLLLALAHAVRQRHLAASFWEKHPEMSNFALNVEGFPAEATDEVEIQDFLRAEFGCETLEVSVCYEYRARCERVYQLLDKLVVEADVDAGTYGIGLAGSELYGLSRAEREEVAGWLGPGSEQSVFNAGSAFVVFKRVEDLPMRSMDERSRQPSSCVPLPRALSSQSQSWPLPQTLQWVGVDGKVYPLRVKDVISEPPDIVWDQIGMSWREFGLRCIAGLAALAACVAGLFLVVFMPFASYVLRHYKESGTQPSDWVISVWGLLVMAANWIMCFVLWSVASRIGFQRKDRQDLVIFNLFAVMCAANFLFNVVTMVFPGGYGCMFQPFGEECGAQLELVSFQLEASMKLFSLLIPGSLFIGYIMWPLQGFVWPLVSTLAYLRCRHCRAACDISARASQALLPRQHSSTSSGSSRRVSPELSAREAELAFEPLGISLAHDYMGHVVQPTCCSLALFFASGVVWQVFLCLAAWSLFMIVFQRYMHLRACKRAYFTTDRLDSQVVRAWGVPLSMVLAASTYWAAKLHGWPILQVVPLAFAIGHAIYLTLLWACAGRKWVSPKILLPAEGTFETYAEVAAKRCYSWHNCNPMKVLLSHCQEKGQQLVPYSLGKGYLQVQQPEEWYMNIRQVRSSILDRCLSSQDPVPDFESLLIRPYQVLSGLRHSFLGDRGGQSSSDEGTSLQDLKADSEGLLAGQSFSAETRLPLAAAGGA